MSPLQGEGRRRLAMKKRRRWLKGALAAAAVLATPLVRLGERAGRVRCIEAVRCRFYPGPRRARDESEIARPGRWAG